MLGLGLGIGAVQAAPLARYSLGGKAPAVIADPVAGVYGLGGRSVAFDSLFTFSRLSAAWKLNALGHWVKVLAGEPRTGHHVWKDGKLVPAGIAVCSEVRTNLIKYSEDLTSWELTNGVTVTPQGSLGGSPSFVLSDQTTTYGHPRQVIGPIGEGEFTCQIKVAKTVGKTNAFGIRIVYTAGGVTHFNGISFNAETGAGILPTWSSSIIERVVQDCGDYWLAWFSFDTTGIGSNDARVEIFPAHNGVNGATGSTRTGDHRCTAVHVNEGRYPQAYIKTEGAPVSTASESLQPDPVKLARAVGVFGPELWDAADASSGAGWAESAGTYTKDATGNAVLGSTILTADSLFIVSFDITQTAGALNLWRRNSDNTNNEQAASNLGTGSYEMVVASGPAPGNDGLFLWFDGHSFTGEIRNLSFRKVTMPEALTFVMKGTTSYADEGLNPQVRLALWQTDGDNRFRFQFNTVDGRTGQFVTLIETDGVANSSASAASVHTPGVEVPFSVAVVLTATDIEGFYNGISNGKVAHSGLPNLLSTPLNLLPVGTATIEHFAIYVGNPGTDALQEATS